MEPLSPDRIVLIAGTPPETLGALVLFAIGIAGAVLGILMVWYRRRGGLTLLILFAALTGVSIYALGHMPSRLVLSQSGMEVDIGPFHDRWSWQKIGAIAVRPMFGGLLVSFDDQGTHAARTAPPWLKGRIRLYVGTMAADPELIETRIANWRTGK